MTCTVLNVTADRSPYRSVIPISDMMTLNYNFENKCVTLCVHKCQFNNIAKQYYNIMEMV